MGRAGRGWALARQSWKVVKSDRSLLLFPVVAGICAVIVAAIFFGAGAGVGAATNSFWAALPLLLIGAYLLTVIGQFCAVALAACATTALDGGTTSFGDGVAAARSRLRLILLWAGVVLIVGAAITALQAALREAGGNIVGSIVGGLANLAWTVATFFVVPIIALEGLGPREAIKRSGSIIRERWGEGVVGSASIGLAAFLLGILPGAAVVFLGFVIVGSSVPLGAVVIAIGVAVIIAASLIQVTLSAVFRVALFRFATAGDAPGHFSSEQLEGAFRPKRR